MDNHATLNVLFRVKDGYLLRILPTRRTIDFAEPMWD